MTRPSNNSSNNNNNPSNANSTNDNDNDTTTSNSNTNNNDPTNGNQSSKKPRRSIKIEGNCLSNMLKEGYAKIIDASRLGKRLSSEIWNSFGAIQVPDKFSNPAIQTKTVADGQSTIKICHYFVACGRCFSVFKYDGHAYGTTGLVKHLKNCQGTNIIRAAVDGNQSGNNLNTPANSTNASNQQNLDGHGGTSLLSLTNGPISTFTKRKKGRTISLSQPSMKSLVRAIDDLRSEQNELKQKIQEMLNLMNSNCMGQIQIITQEGDKVDETFQSTS
jgi:hypothetical protein